MTPYTYRATVLVVHDGDTFRASIDLGFGVSYRTLVRLNGCNARELSMTGGPEARDNLASLLARGDVVLTSVSWDKFGGRIDADVQLPGAVDLVSELVATGWALRWDGKGVKPVPVWPRAAVTA